MISNSTPLICLAKIKQLELLKILFNKTTIPESVKKEVMKEGKPGFSEIENAIKNKWILIENPKKSLNINLGKGENDAISLAKEKNDSLIIDDSVAIKIADSMNIKCVRTTKILFLALEKDIINKEQTKILFLKLIQNGYYIKPDIFAKIWEFLDGY